MFATRTLAVVALSSCGIAFAQPGEPANAEPNLSGQLWLRVGGGHSDNIRRTVVLPESGSYSAYGLESDLDYTSTRLTTRFVADLERRRYSTADIQDETVGNAELDVEVAAIPDRFIFLVSDEFNQGRVDSLLVTSPENRAEANVFSVGPRIILPLGLRTTLSLEALQQERSVAGFTSLDGDARVSTASFARAMDTTTEFSLVLSSQLINYNTNPSDYKIESAFLSYNKTLASGSAYLGVGSTRSVFEGSRSSTPYVDLSWVRDVGARSRLQISATQQLVDFFDDFRFGTGSDTVLGQDVYEQRLVSVSYSIEGVRNSLSLTHGITQARYTTLLVTDYDESVSGVEFSRSLTRGLALNVGYSDRTRDLDIAVRTDSSQRWRLSLTRGIGRRFAFSLGYESLDDNDVLGNKVEENVIQVFFRYAATTELSRQP